MAISGFRIGRDIQHALGLPKGTTYIEIRIGLKEPVEVLCTYYPSPEAMAETLAVLKRYAVIEREAPSDERQRRLRSRLDAGE